MKENIIRNLPILKGFIVIYRIDETFVSVGYSDKCIFFRNILDKGMCINCLFHRFEMNTVTLQFFVALHICLHKK